MRNQILQFVTTKFAEAEYEVNYNLSPEECLKRHFICFAGWGKNRFIRERAHAYKGSETAETLKIGSLFTPHSPFLEQFEAEASVHILPTDTISDLVAKIYELRRAQRLSDIAEEIRSWNISAQEIYGSLAPVSIH